VTGGPLVPEVAGRTADVGASELAARLPRSPTRTRSSPAARPCSTGAGASALVLDFFRDLLPQSPRSAARLLGQLFRLDGHAFEHSDESRDAIAEVIRQAVTDYSQAWAAVSERDIDALPANVLAVYLGNAYGVHDEIIVAFGHALGRAGFDVGPTYSHRVGDQQPTPNGRRIATDRYRTPDAGQIRELYKSVRPPAAWAAHVAVLADLL
jgi:hypothetical protein